MFFNKDGRSLRDTLLAWNEKFTIQVRHLEYVAATFMLSMATLTYLYGTLLICPEVLEYYNYGSLSLYLLRLFATWVLFSIFANFYLLRKRKSSIQGRMLLQPIVKPMSSDMSYMNPDIQLRETAKHMGEHFKDTPFGETNNWHICGVCEVFVPPRAWHCHSCNSCILRRDHHCIFTGGCIGEENHSNFIGLLLYLGIGASISAFFSIVYFLLIKEMVWWWFIVRSALVIYSVFYDFNVVHILASVNCMGQLAAWGVFSFYIHLALKGQTSADCHRKIVRTMPYTKSYSYQNMCDFLGPNPIIRILWPLHEPLKVSYGSPEFEDRKGL